MKVVFAERVSDIIWSIIPVVSFCLVFLFSYFPWISPLLLIISYLFFKSRIYNLIFEDNFLTVVYSLKIKNKAELFNYEDIDSITIDYSEKFGARSQNYIDVIVRNGEKKRISTTTSDVDFEKLRTIIRSEKWKNKIIVKAKPKIHNTLS